MFTEWCNDGKSDDDAGTTIAPSDVLDILDIIWKVSITGIELPSSYYHLTLSVSNVCFTSAKPHAHYRISRNLLFGRYSFVG